jgi:protein-disulfide isomerase-like protein with CxxC motif
VARDDHRQIHYSFQRQFKARPSNQEDRVRVELLTDPWSVWCWGFEPVRRALELRYPTIEFHALVGGMFPEMPDHASAGFDVSRFFQQVQRTTGMPAETAVLEDARPDSTFPACLFVFAARQASPHLGDAYLRALREAVYLDGRNASDDNVALDVAAAAGVDLDRFERALSDGSAEEAFEMRLAELRANDLYAYPTLLVTYNGKTTRVEGFQSLPAVLAIAEALSGHIHAPLPDPALTDIVPRGQRVVTREVAEVLGISMERAYDRLAEAEGRGVLARVRLPKADAWARADVDGE